LYGVLMVAGTLIPLSFVSFHEEITRWSHRADDNRIWTVAVLVFLAAMVSFALLLKPLEGRVQGNPLARLQQLAGRQWLPFALVLALAAVALLSFGDKP